MYIFIYKYRKDSRRTGTEAYIDEVKDENTYTLLVQIM